jgi:fructose-1,6-bisphosphatase/inositol monophosphatase family enzyme
VEVNVTDPRLLEAVERLINVAIEREILRKFKQLASSDISQKDSGELVTIADRRAEDLLSDELTKLIPGSTVVGEEAAAEDPRILLNIGDSGPVWIVDAIDGTENFAAGSPRFAVVVALAVDGVVRKSWIVAPLLGTTAVATAGQGASINGVPARVARSDRLRHLDVSAPQPRWWSRTQRSMINSLSGCGVALCFFDVAGLEYLELASGRRSATVLTWEAPWDHAAGVLLHAEAGGVSLTGAGEPYRIGGANALPMVVAGNFATAVALRDALNARTKDAVTASSDS